MRICGIDGCRNGWVVALREENSVFFRVLPHFSEILKLPIDVIAVDIPIGLPESGPRLADQLARQSLGWPRCSSVFSAPIRPLLKTITWPEANTLLRQIENKGLPQQSWGIVAKIKEVDEVLRSSPEHQKRVFEIHPELSFWQMAGKPMEHPKRKPEGRRERLKHLGSFGVTDSSAQVHARLHRCKADDVVDAMAALWTAERIAGNQARRFPEQDTKDSVGLNMRMWA